MSASRTMPDRRKARRSEQYWPSRDFRSQVEDEHDALARRRAGWSDARIAQWLGWTERQVRLRLAWHERVLEQWR